MNIAAKHLHAITESLHFRLRDLPMNITAGHLHATAMNQRFLTSRPKSDGWIAEELL